VKIVPLMTHEIVYKSYINATGCLNTILILFTYLLQDAGNMQAGYESVPPVPQFRSPKTAICNLVASKDSTGKYQKQ
jgi:hypothetical protein